MAGVLASTSICFDLSVFELLAIELWRKSYLGGKCPGSVLLAYRVSSDPYQHGAIRHSRAVANGSNTVIGRYY